MRKIVLETNRYAKLVIDGMGNTMGDLNGKFSLLQNYERLLLSTSTWVLRSNQISKYIERSLDQCSIVPLFLIL